MNVFDPIAIPGLPFPAGLPIPFVRVIEGFLPPSECDALRRRIDALGPEAAPITTGRGAVMRPEVRNNDRVIFDDAALASTLFSRARSALPETLHGDSPRTTHREGPLWRLTGFNERFRGYRYRPGQRFAPHYDGCFRRGDTEESAITVLLYLDEGCEGGETTLLDWHVTVTPTTGTLFVFDHFLLHEGAEVRSGEKHVLRTDAMYRRAPASGIL